MVSSGSLFMEIDLGFTLARMFSFSLGTFVGMTDFERREQALASVNAGGNWRRAFVFNNIADAFRSLMLGNSMPTGLVYDYDPLVNAVATEQIVQAVRNRTDQDNCSTVSESSESIPSASSSGSASAPPYSSTAGTPTTPTTPRRNRAPSTTPVTRENRTSEATFAAQERHRSPVVIYSPSVSFSFNQGMPFCHCR
jgi:hypothetical protein